MSEKYTPDEAELVGCYAGAMAEQGHIRPSEVRSRTPHLQPALAWMRMPDGTDEPHRRARRTHLPLRAHRLPAPSGGIVIETIAICAAIALAVVAVTIFVYTVRRVLKLRRATEAQKRGRVYPPPHHGGSAADVEHHWPGCGHE